MTNFHGKDNIYAKGLVLRVRDLEVSESFYRDLLGFRLLAREDSRVLLTADGKSPIITLKKEGTVLAKAPRRTGLYHFALLLPSELELGLFLKQLVKAQYPLAGGSNHGVSQAIYFDDPDRNGIEVYADLDPEDWVRRDDSIEMVTLPLDYERLLSLAGDQDWQGMPEKTILGHMHLHVADLEEAKKFYIDGLGMDLILEMGGSAVFTSSAGYHHHIAFNIWAGRGAKPLDDSMAGMDYYSLEFPSRRVMEERLERLKALGFASFEREGRVFIEDPSKNTLEFIVRA